MKAREVKRAKLVARYAEKRAALKKTQERQPHPSAQPLQDHGSSEGLHAPVRPLPYPVP